jgi:hypothetical protein
VPRKRHLGTDHEAANSTRAMRGTTWPSHEPFCYAPVAAAFLMVTATQEGVDGNFSASEGVLHRRRTA